MVREKKISGIELAKQLQLEDSERLRNWVVKLVDQKILVTEGKTKGTMYQVNPQLLASIDHDLKPSLRTIEPHALEALIKEDVKIHPSSSVKSIHSRMEDIDLSIVKKAIYRMVESGELQAEGSNKFRAYSLANKK